MAWIALEPRRWFEDAYAEQGPRGEEGPRGPVGRQGPPGPVGPAAIDAVGQLEASLSDVDSRVTELEAGLGLLRIDLEALSDVDTSLLESSVSDLESSVSDLESGVSDLSSAVEETAGRLESVCSQLRLSDVEVLYDIYVFGC